MNERAKRKIWFERNEQAEELESEGKYEEAIKLYEQNVAEECDVAYTYERLAALYAGKERYDDEAKALARALQIEKRRGPSDQVIRLEKRIAQSKLAESRTRAASGGARRRTDAAEPLLRSSTATAKKSKGCMTVLVVLGAVISSFFI